MIYRPLNSSNKEIRLVILKAGAEPDHFACQLRYVSLNDAPSYDALSYVWGDPNSRVSILLDGHAFEVTRNLGTALRYLRDPQRDRVLWIDAICINQDNKDERAAQVRIMRNIYQSADQVVSWLGEGDVFSDAAQDFIKAAFNNDFSREWLLELLSSEDRTKQNGLFGLVECLVESGREYWGRLWITQEIAAARDGYLLIGSFELPHHVLQQVGNVFNCDSIIRDASQRDVHSGLHRLSIHVLSTLKTNFQYNPVVTKVVQGVPLLDLLITSGWKSASDDRDKLFGLLGLSDLCESDHPGLKIDYHRSVREVYTGVALAIIDANSSLDILSVCGLTEGGFSSENNIPSWVPDWTKEHPFGLIMKNDRAAGGSSASPKLHSDSYTLSTVGFRIGKVKERMAVVPTIGYFDIDPQQHVLQDVLRGVNNWRNLLRETFGSLQDLDIELLQTTLLGYMDLQTIRNVLIMIDEASNNPAFNLRTDWKSQILDVCLREMLNRITVPFFIETNINESFVEHATVPHVGMGLPSVNQGDEICIFLGCQYPMVIRNQGNHYKIIGPSYIHKVAGGEAMADLENGVYELEAFDLR